MSRALRKLRRNVEGRHRVVPLRPSSRRAEFKMSEVLLEFAEPLLKDIANDTDYRKAIAIAVLFWDLALLPENEHAEKLNEMARDLAATTGDTPKMIDYFKSLGEAFLLRKKTLFPNIKRTITSFEVIDEGDSVRVLVASAPI